MNLSACLIVTDIIPDEDCYGFGILSVKNWDTESHRSLFYIGWNEGLIRFELGFFIINEGGF